MNNNDFLEELNIDEEIDNLYEIQHKNLEKNSKDLLNQNMNKSTIIYNNDELLNKNEDEIKNKLNDLLKEAHNTLKNEKKDSKIISFIIGFFRYITTSALIFAILLLTTNYSAYYNIAKSYIYKNQMKQEQNSILNSVSAAQITKKIKKDNKIAKRIKKENKTQIEKYSIKKLVTIANQNTPKLDIDITPYENRIIIPKIAKNIPLIDIKNQEVKGPKQLENIFMKELEDGVIRYPGSSKPGRPGNTFVFGHSSNFPWIKGDYNNVFATLDNVKYGDKVIMYYNQKKYVYMITKKRIIKPGDVSILKNNKNKDELTLMTCWPVGTTLNRLIVTGELIK